MKKEIKEKSKLPINEGLVIFALLGKTSWKNLHPNDMLINH
jgi:hypothetical protein